MEFDFVAFDMQRMWLGDWDLMFLLEIVCRVVIIFVYAILLLRLLDDEGMKDMSFLDYFIVIALGSAAGDPMFYPSVPLIYCLTVITVVIWLKYFLTRLTLHHKRIQNLIQPKPWCLVINWELQTKMLKKKRLSQETLFSQLRIKWIENIGQIRRCYLEPSWELSIFKFVWWEIRDWISTMPPIE